MKIPLGGLLGKLFNKVGSPFKEPIARAIYSQFMQSPTGKRLQTWVPLLSATAVLGIYIAKAFGWVGAESAMHWLQVLGIQPGISEAELAIAAGIAAGLFRKYAGMILAAKGEVVPPNSAPVLKTLEQFKDFNARVAILMAEPNNLGFDEARNLALRGVIAANAPVAAPAKAEMKAEAKAEVKEAVVEASGRGVEAAGRKDGS